MLLTGLRRGEVFLEAGRWDGDRAWRTLLPGAGVGGSSSAVARLAELPGAGPLLFLGEAAGLPDLAGASARASGRPSTEPLASARRPGGHCLPRGAAGRRRVVRGAGLDAVEPLYLRAAERAAQACPMREEGSADPGRPADPVTPADASVAVDRVRRADGVSSLDPGAVPLPAGGPSPRVRRALAEIVELERCVSPIPGPRAPSGGSWPAGRGAGILVSSSSPGRSALTASPGSSADEAHLANLAMDPDHRGRGFARAVAPRLLAEARRRETANVWLEVRAGNAVAIRLYRTHGFRVAGIRKGYYQKEREDALVMVLPLAAEHDRGGSGQDRRKRSEGRK